MTEIRKESFNVVTSAGMGIQRKDKIGYEILCANREKKAVTAYLIDTLGKVNGYDQKYTEFIIKSFGMNQELSDYFRRQVIYYSQEISGVLGLKNASDLLYDKTPKELGLIHPPFLPNLRFSRFALTEELICWGSFCLDPDLYLVKNPTFYLHKSQLQDDCMESQQQMEMIYQPYDLTFETSPVYDTD